MKKTLYFLTAAVLFSANALAQDFSSKDVEFFQPPIISSKAPSNPHNLFSLYNNSVRAGLNEFVPLIPSYTGKGNLIASWNPAFFRPTNKITFVVFHGGHGMGPTEMATGLWLKNEFNANVLLLDSYWSRGREENWKTYTQFGVNMRMLDAIAAGRWLKSQGIDSNKVFLVGGSQGGWTVLRTFTDEPFIKYEAQSLFRGGIALYPNCYTEKNKWAPRLGPYYAPVQIFVGDKDTATPYTACDRDIFEDAEDFVIYEGQTHAWDIANRGTAGIPVDGECFKALNVYNKFSQCRSNQTTNDMRRRIKNFIEQFKL